MEIYTTCDNCEMPIKNFANAFCKGHFDNETIWTTEIICCSADCLKEATEKKSKETIEVS